MNVAPGAQADRKALNFAMNLSLGIGLLMFVMKVGAYLLTGSAAILSDAAESVVHVAAVIFAAYSLRLSYKPADEDRLYGHSKISFFSAGFEGAMIILAALYIIYESIHKWMTGLPAGKPRPRHRADRGGRRHQRRAGRLSRLAGPAEKIPHPRGQRQACAHRLLDQSGRVGRLGPGAGHQLAALRPDLRHPHGLQHPLLGRRPDEDPPSAASWTRPTRRPRRNSSKSSTARREQRGISYHDLRHRNLGDAHRVEVHLLFPAGTSLAQAHREATRIEQVIQESLEPRAYVTTHLECASDHDELHPDEPMEKAVPPSPASSTRPTASPPK